MEVDMEPLVEVGEVVGMHLVLQALFPSHASLSKILAIAIEAQVVNSLMEMEDRVEWVVAGALQEMILVHPLIVTLTVLVAMAPPVPLLEQMLMEVDMVLPLPLVTAEGMVEVEGMVAEEEEGTVAEDVEEVDLVFVTPSKVVLAIEVLAANSLMTEQREDHRQVVGEEGMVAEEVTELATIAIK